MQYTAHINNHNNSVTSVIDKGHFSSLLSSSCTPLSLLFFLLVFMDLSQNPLCCDYSVCNAGYCWCLTQCLLYIYACVLLLLCLAFQAPFRILIWWKVFKYSWQGMWNRLFSELSISFSRHVNEMKVLEIHYWVHIRSKVITCWIIKTYCKAWESNRNTTSLFSFLKKPELHDLTFYHLASSDLWGNVRMKAHYKLFAENQSSCVLYLICWMCVSVVCGYARTRDIYM